MSGSFRSGFVAVMGRPNVGKSTLLNALVGQKVAIVSPRPQTTRRRQLGILTLPDAQIIFVDTPGVHRPRHALGKHLLAAATEAVGDADAILWVADVSEPPAPDDRLMAELIAGRTPGTPVVLALNKSDRLKPENVLPYTEAFRALAPDAEWLLTSATRGDNLRLLVPLLVARLPEGPQYYDEDDVTNFNMREVAAELVREAALFALRDEIPHGIAVEIEEFLEEEGRPAIIRAILYVERENHKGMVIGKRGEMIKRIGTQARKEIEAQRQGPVYLELRVKVRDDWRKDEREVKRLGYGARDR